MTLPAVLFVLVQSNAAADGGISSISEIIARLKRHRPIIVTDRETDRLSRWRSHGIETHILPQAASEGFRRAPFRVARSYASYTARLRRIIRQSGANVIHANDPAAFQLALPAAKLSRGVRIILNLRDTLDPDRPLPSRRYRFLFSAADHVFYLSRDMANRWEKVAANAKRAFSVTYSIVDPERFPAAPLYTGDGPPVILLSGIVRAKKGQLDFIRNVSPTLAQHGIETWIAGDFDPSANPYMAACAEAAAPLGEAVRFLGYQSDVPALMRRSAAIAIASRHEGLVRAMIEAMSCGRPVVSFDICSAREILAEQSGGAGKVVAVGDHAAMAEALVNFCVDRPSASEAGGKGRETASRLFAPVEVVARYEDVYERLAGSRR